MNQITTLSNEANQIVSAVLEDGSVATIHLVYLGSVQRWIVDVAWGTWEMKGLIVCRHPNMLRAYRNIIPFGLACTAVDNVDPVEIEDFSSGRCQLLVLNTEEVARAENELMGAAS